MTSAEVMVIEALDMYQFNLQRRQHVEHRVICMALELPLNHLSDCGNAATAYGVLERAAPLGERPTFRKTACSHRRG